VKKLRLGTDPKKVLILGGILAVLGYFLWQNYFSDPLGTGSAATAPKKTPSSVVNDITRPGSAGTEARPVAGARQSRQDFKLTVKRSEGVNAADIDPTLRLDLLARLKAVQLSGTERSLFDFSTAPVAKQPEPKIVVAKAAPKMIGPEPPPPPPPKPVKPPPPPIPFKFYGMLTPRSGGSRRAFLLDGEEILTPAEGDTIKKRYRIVRVGVNSVVVEDLDFQAQQTLTLAEEPAG